MIYELTELVLIELAVVLGMYIVTWITNIMYYEPPEPQIVYSGELSPEQAEALQKVFGDGDEQD